ncbi:MAG: hypothetical protein DRN88_05165 [Candidatus Hydrothermarchaeota archaeon]|nr:MAG: hypothetical protein DRN88_05165 [Candidatus Hydrothermarchaeota archaeon]
MHSYRSNTSCNLSFEEKKMKLEEELKAFNLNSYEARVYLALLRESMTPKQISEHAKVPLPRIYDTLKSLEAKGFVIKGEKYSAIAPEIALESRILQFRAEFENSIKEIEAKKNLLAKKLSSLYLRKPSTHEVAVLKGINSIISKFLEIMNEASEIHITIRKALKAKELFKSCFQNLETKNKKIFIILPEETKISKEDKEYIKKHGIKVKFHNTLFDLLVTEKDVLIGVPDPTAQEPYHSIAIWIRNEVFAKAIQQNLKET